MSFGTILRKMRLSRGLTQAQCARQLLQTSRSHVSKLESGHMLPSFPLLYRVARAFAVERMILRIRLPRTSIDG